MEILYNYIHCMGAWEASKVSQWRPNFIWQQNSFEFTERRTISIQIYWREAGAQGIPQQLSLWLWRMFLYYEKRRCSDKTLTLFSCFVIETDGSPFSASTIHSLLQKDNSGPQATISTVWKWRSAICSFEEDCKPFVCHSKRMELVLVVTMMPSFTYAIFAIFTK